jgi:hypothetical protein
MCFIKAVAAVRAMTAETGEEEEQQQMPPPPQQKMTFFEVPLDMQISRE